MPSASPRERQLMRSATTFDYPTDNQDAGRWIPRPDIPVLPVLSVETFGLRKRHATPAVVDNGRAVYVAAGRMAISHALEMIGIRPGQKVLVPAYHCVSMVEPIVHFGGDPVFYALRDDLSIDLDDIAAKIDQRTCALMAVNYFGFPQDLSAIRRFCDDRGLAFIEDCAHSFFGSFGGRPLGSFGDFAIASLTKFFPVRDGGCLIANATRSGHQRLALRSQGIGANIAAVLDTLEDAVHLGRLGALKPAVNLINRGKQIIRALAPGAKRRRSDNPAQLRSGQPGGFDPSWMGVRATAASQVVGEYASRRHIVESRRRNYLRMVQEFSGLRGCRPVFPRLGDGVVPYMFPLWVDHLPDRFATLEDSAVPMQRFGQFPWPGMDPGTCDITAQLARNSIQLPCHQGLTEDEILALVSRVRAVAG
jgi:perosamine synthetase